VNDNYMQRVNPNLLIVLHYTGKALWLLLAAVFGVIGYRLYALGIEDVGGADAALPLGISFTLQDAGPGLVVMVIALLCSLVGAVKSKVELTPEAIRVMAPPDNREQRDGNDGPEVHDPGVIDRIETLQMTWGLSEIAQLYRTPVKTLVSVGEADRIAELQHRKPLPDSWPSDVSSVVRSSERFAEWLRDLPNRDLPSRRNERLQVDSSLPWCVRLRWGAGVSDTVDIFVYATREGEGA